METARNQKGLEPVSRNNNIRAMGLSVTIGVVVIAIALVSAYLLHRGSQMQNGVTYTVMRVEPAAITISEHKVVDAYRLYLDCDSRLTILKPVVPRDVLTIDETLPFDTAMWNRVEIDGRSYTLVRWHPKNVLPEPAESEQNLDDPPLYPWGGS